LGQQRSESCFAQVAPGATEAPCYLEASAGPLPAGTYPVAVQFKNLSSDLPTGFIRFWNFTVERVKA
jgi:hypothetical protein